MKPHGVKIGQALSKGNDQVRTIYGQVNNARAFFDKIVKGGTEVATSSTNVIRFELANGAGSAVLRNANASSTLGAIWTIGLKIPGLGIDAIKFFE